MTPPLRPDSVEAARASLRDRLFPSGIPALWCPPITHYEPQGGIDADRTRAHLRHLSQSLHGVLVPGSTGDAWELSDDEALELLEVVLPEARRLNLHVLVGALRPSHADVHRLTDRILRRFASDTPGPDPAARLAAAGIAGFTVCPPCGAELGEAEIESALETFLERRLPTALYQLPQVTSNEMAPATVARLLQRHPHLLLLKDTSGHDRVALAGLDLPGLFLVRGAEGDYARWLQATGGPYHGFLLSSANGFAPQLHQLLALLRQGETQAASQLSNRVSRTVAAVFQLVAPLPHGNAFANANKAVDHWFAHGPAALSAPPPRLHAGPTLPPEVIAQTGDLLRREGFLPDRGYLH